MKAKDKARVNPKDEKRVEEVRKQALLSMDNVFLEIGTRYPNIVSKQAIPPHLREQIFRQILSLKDKEDKPMLGIISDDQSLPNFTASRMGMVLVDQTARNIIASYFVKIIKEDSNDADRTVD